jgi:hypothetical protein
VEYLALTTLRLEPAPVAAVTAPKVSEETPKKSTDKAVEETPTEEKTVKSRSRSRGPFGFLKTKKDEIKEKTEGEDKKEETPAVEPSTTEAAAAGKCTTSQPNKFCKANEFMQSQLQ